MAWLWWLSAPVAVTASTSLLIWWRGRARRTPRPATAIRRHQAFLAALRLPPGADGAAPGPVPGTARTNQP